MKSVAAGRPCPKVAGICGQDRLRGQDARESRDDTAGMHPGSIPGLRIDDRAGFVRRPVDGVGRRSLFQRRGVECGPTQDSLSHPQERGHVRSHRDVRSVRRGRATWFNVDVGPSRIGPGDSITEGREFAQPASQHEQGVGLFEAGLNTGRRPKAGHAEVQRVVIGEDVPAPPR